LRGEIPKQLPVSSDPDMKAHGVKHDTHGSGVTVPQLSTED
jgi:hypothetical protein